MRCAAVARKCDAGPAAKARKAAKAASNSPSVRESNDALEQEAERVAQDVIAGRAQKQAWSISNVGIGTALQPKCACGGPPGPGGECEECRKKRLQRKIRGSAIETRSKAEAETPAIVGEVLRSAGQPLDPSIRAFMEPRFGRDFSQVRVHTDAKASGSARAVSALAYTVGHDIVLALGDMPPSLTPVVGSWRTNSHTPFNRLPQGKFASIFAIRNRRGVQSGGKRKRRHSRRPW